MLGPKNLDKKIIRAILKNKKYRTSIDAHNSGDIEWNHGSLVELKKSIRLALRLQQKQRCFYCRSIIPLERRNRYENIEHFLDKSKEKYRRWSLCCVNLTLSCGACNGVKAIRDMGDDGIRNSKGYVSGAGDYRWLHPYFDDFHENVEIERGWVYAVKEGAPQRERAKRMLEECELYKVKK